MSSSYVLAISACKTLGLRPYNLLFLSALIFTLICPKYNKHDCISYFISQAYLGFLSAFTIISKF